MGAGWKNQTARSTLDWPQGYYLAVVCEISDEMARIRRKREQFKRIRRLERLTPDEFTTREDS